MNEYELMALESELAQLSDRITDPVRVYPAMVEFTLITGDKVERLILGCLHGDWVIENLDTEQVIHEFPNTETATVRRVAELMAGWLANA